MKLKDKIKETVDKVTEAVGVIDEDKVKIHKWESKLDTAKDDYSSTVSEMENYKKLYNGTRYVSKDPNRGSGKSTKQANTVYNIVYEFIESMQDNTIPYIKVKARSAEDVRLAKVVENTVNNAFKTLGLAKINDIMERNVPVYGGDFFMVDWDNKQVSHNSIGSVSVKEMSPLHVYPQPGVKNIDDMDYIFVCFDQTKNYVKAKYGVDVDNAEEDSVDGNTKDDIVVVNYAYYRNKTGGIGLFAWVDDYVLIDYEDYQARHIKRCKKCGEPIYGEQCTCGSKQFVDSTEEYEELIADIVQSNGNVIPASYEAEDYVYDEDGDRQIDIDNGTFFTTTQIKVQKLPYYNPNKYPLILRRNVTDSDRFIGRSDVDVIKDQQENIKKLGSIAQERLTTAGSIITLPRSVNIEQTEKEFKVARIDNASQKALIDVLTCEADTSQLTTQIALNYSRAQYTLGLSDAYLGRYDASATSGSAKQISIGQTSGRLESKRVMKRSAYEDLAEMIFKYMLAYQDEKVPFLDEDPDDEYTAFSRYDFLKQDSAGEWYYVDDFIFEADPTTSSSISREVVWQQIDQKYQAGGFGPLGETKTLYRLWKLLEGVNYPIAGQMRAEFEKQLKEEEQQAQQVQQQMGGIQNALSQM